VAQALAYADARVRGDKPLAGGTFGLADIAIGVALEYLDLRYAHDWRGKHPGLAAWLVAVSARASFVATRPPPA